MYIEFAVSWIKHSHSKLSIRIMWLKCYQMASSLTHWGQVTHICSSKLTIIGSDNGVSSDQPQTVIWTNDRILLIWTLVTNFSEILSEIHTLSLKKNPFENTVWKMAAILPQPLCVKPWWKVIFLVVRHNLITLAFWISRFQIPFLVLCFYRNGRCCFVTK